MKMHENRNNNMEQFFEENNQYVATTTAQTQQSNDIKRPLTLDLNAATNNNKQHTKKQRFNQSVITPGVLNSPDLNMLKMDTPDLEKFIITNASTLQTPTPGLVFGPVKVSSEAEEYARGFEVALNNLRNNENAQQQSTTENDTTKFLSGAVTIVTNPPATTSTATSSANRMCGGSVTYTNLDEGYPRTIKDEPQTGPNSPPMSPIDMESQEKIKLERKRQRNRVAAFKCRKRKLERISKLEDKVKSLKGENAELGSVIKTLKEQVFALKQQVIDHINSGCSLPSCNVQYIVSKPQNNTNDSDIKYVKFNKND